MFYLMKTWNVFIAIIISCLFITLISDNSGISLNKYEEDNGKILSLKPRSKNETGIYQHQNLVTIDGTNSSFLSIQDAIDNCKERDTLIIWPGQYNETIYVNKQVNLVGIDRNSTIINGEYKSSTIEIISDNCLIENLTVINSSRALRVLEFELYTGINEAGLWIDSSRNVIRNCRFIDNGYGIVILNGDENVIENCVFEKGEFSGIRIDSYDYKNRVRFCYFFPDSGGCGGRGIIESNVFDGCSLRIGSSSTAKNNRIYSSYWEGIDISDTYWIKNHTIIEDNIITNCGIGIFSFWSHYFTIRNNIIRDSEREGMNIFEASDFKIIDNTIENSGKAGIDIEFCNNVVIKSNTITNSGGKDIIIDSQSFFVTIEDNKADVENGSIKRNLCCGSICSVPILITYFPHI